MAAWDWEQPIYSDGVAVLPRVCKFGWLAINVSAENQNQSPLNKSGWLEASVEIRGSRFVVHRQLLSFGDQLIEIPYRNYRVRFKANESLQNAFIKINQLSEVEINQIMALYAPTNTVLTPQVSSNSASSTFGCPVFAAITPPATFLALAANAQRLGFAITNTSKNTIYVDFVAPTALLKRMITIPADGVYVDDTRYAGAVYAWSCNASVQSAEIRELLP
jgi:hypothetical protein